MNLKGLNKTFTSGMDVWVTTQDPGAHPNTTKLKVFNVGNNGHAVKLTDVGPEHDDYPKTRKNKPVANKA